MPHKEEEQRDHNLYDMTVGLSSFLPLRVFCLLSSAAGGYCRAVPYPIPSAIYIPFLPQALSAAHTRNKILPKNHTPTTEQEFSRGKMFL